MQKIDHRESRKDLISKVNENFTEMSAALVHPKVYTVQLSQTGTAAPTAKILRNQLGDVVWARTSIGVYTLTKTGAFIIDKTAPIDDIYYDQSGNCYKINHTSTDVITLQTYAATNLSAPADDILVNRFIHIEIYS